MYNITDNLRLVDLVRNPSVFGTVCDVKLKGTSQTECHSSGLQRNSFSCPAAGRPQRRRLRWSLLRGWLLCKYWSSVTRQSQRRETLSRRWKELYDINFSISHTHTQMLARAHTRTQEFVSQPEQTQKSVSSYQDSGAQSFISSSNT